MDSEKTPKPIEFPHIAAELQQMRDVDQEMRTLGIQDPKNFDSSIDMRNTERMKGIISEIGYPTKLKVGEKGENNAWLLIQHADHDVEFQTSCLGLMKEASDDEIERWSIAYLEDRIRINQGKKQLYGTQFTQEGNKHVPLPIEDEENVDTRRAELGMDTLADQIQRMYEAYPFETKE